MKNITEKSLSEMNITELLSLTELDVFSRIRTGEWSLYHFKMWIDDKLNCTFSDGYEEGYDTAESIERKNGYN